MAKKMNYDFLDCVKQMPPLKHSSGGGTFDISKSEAAAWITSQPDVQQKIFDMARYHGAIKYDPDTGTWRGSGYDGN